MIQKTQGIVARVTPFSETSRMVIWLTEDSGKISTLIKGSQRPKSFFLGQYDLFYTCELLFYYHDRDSAHIARECSPIKTRDALRHDWRAAATASYLVDLVARISPVKAPSEDVFQLLETHLDYLAAEGTSLNYIFWLELKLMETLGFAPRLQTCMDCGTKLLPTYQACQFDYARGGLLCARCSQGIKNTITISPEVAGTLSGWQQAAQPHIARRTQLGPRPLQDLENLLGLFISYHLDVSLAGRAIALDTVRRVIQAA